MSLPVEDMASVGAAIAGCDLTPPRDALTSPPHLRDGKAPAAARGGRATGGRRPRRHRPSGGGARSRAGVDRSHGRLPRRGAGSEDRSALRHHAMIMRRFRRAVEENPDQALYIPELCKAIGVADRTLRVCCQEQLGMSPKRYLLLRRMHLAAASAAREHTNRDNRDRDRHAIRLLAIRAVRRGIQVALRGISLRHARSPARAAV